MFSWDTGTLEKLVYTLGICTSSWLFQEDTLAQSIFKTLFNPPPPYSWTCIFPLNIKLYPFYLKCLKSCWQHDNHISDIDLSYFIVNLASNLGHLIYNCFGYYKECCGDYISIIQIFVHTEYIPRKWNCSVKIWTF